MIDDQEPTQPPQLWLERVSIVSPVGSHSLLEDISFKIFEGDRLLLSGPSGAGKTLLLRLLNRLSEPTHGSIYLDDRPVGDLPVLQLRQMVTLVPQESKLLGMTVGQTLAYPLTLRGMKSPDIQHRVEYWCDRLHLPKNWMNRTEAQLSVGQRQLVAIARALVIQPQILLLDEPTSALDRGRSTHLLQVLTQLPESHNMTVVMTNHQLEVGRDFCTRLLYLQEGQLRQNIPAHRVDWSALQDTLVQAEMQAVQEWE